MANNEQFSADETITYDSGNHEGPPELRFIHYNDVYHVDYGSQEPVGGIARFKTLCDHYQKDEAYRDQPNVMTLFSGDAFNPSLESAVTKGGHMVPALNAINTSVACLGNHDLDFGIEQFKYLAASCDFPWLCANVLDPASGERPLGDCQKSVMLSSSNGIKIGFIGIVEREWLDTINSLPPDLIYKSASATTAEIAPRLRSDGAEMIVVLTHQREPNDNKLARKLAPDTVDLILGGHDHFYGHSFINGTHVLRSGSDFKQLSYLEARRKRKGESGWDFNIIRRDVVSSIHEDSEAMEMARQVTASLKSKLDKPLGYTAVPLDARFETVRKKESNIGNFVCDLMRFHYFADCAIMAAGTVRGDQVYPAGVLTVRDLLGCFPFEDPCVVIGTKGKDLLAALENGVSTYPALEGRFPQVSGIHFSFDPDIKEGPRCSDVYVGHEPLDLLKEYKAVVRAYMVEGKDGYTSLMLEELGGPARSIVSEENGMILSVILRQYFMSLKVLGKWKHWDDHLDSHWDAIHDDLHDVHPVKEAATPNQTPQSNAITSNGHLDEQSLPLRKKQKTEPTHHHIEHTESEDDEEHIHLAPIHHEGRDRELFIMRKYIRRWWKSAGLPGHPDLLEDHGDNAGVAWTMAIAPMIQGRITVIGGDRDINGRPIQAQ